MSAVTNNLSNITGRPLTEPAAGASTGSDEVKSLIQNSVRDINSLNLSIQKNIKQIDQAALKLNSLIESHDSIQKPTIDLLNAIEFVMGLVETSHGLQIKVKNNDLTAYDLGKKELNKARLEKLRESIKKREEEANKQNEQKTSSSVSLALSLTGLLVGILGILTAGTMAALVAAVLGTLLTTTLLGMDIQNRVWSDQNVKEKDIFGNERKKEISFGRLVRLADEENFKKNNSIEKMSDKEKLDQEKKFSNLEQSVDIAVTVMMVAVALVGIIGSIPAAVKGVSTLIKNIGQTIEKFRQKLVPELIKSVSKGGLKSGETVSKGVTETSSKISETTSKAKELKSLVLQTELGRMGTIASLSDDVVNIINAISDAAGASIGIQLATIRFDLKTVDNEYNMLGAEEEAIDHYRELITQTIKDMSKRYEENLDALLDMVSAVHQYQNNIAERI